MADGNNSTLQRIEEPMDKKSIHEQVTEQIVTMLEQGTLPWRKPWKSTGSAIPANAVSKRPYHGINRVILWTSALVAGYPTHAWATYRQIQEAGGQVRKGEKGTRVMLYRPLEQTDASESEEGESEGRDARPTRIARVFTVFNLAQCDGLEAPQEPETVTVDPIPAARDFLAHVKATVRLGGDRACYMPSPDVILLPAPDSFTSAEAYYATSLHEHCHWTGHASRLSRNEKWAPFGSEAYACEELVAELGAAFLCAELSIKGELEHHASYLQNWLDVLKQDKTALFRAAADASRAAVYLHSLQPAAKAERAA
jgi:antirestriction protein ArdC